MARTKPPEEPKLRFLLHDCKNNANNPNRTISIVMLNKIGVDNLTSIGPFTKDELRGLRKAIKDFIRTH